MKISRSELALAVLIFSASACGGGAGTGTIKLVTKGDESITAPIPADSPAKTGFVDGWVVTYKKFLVVIKATTIADSTSKVLVKQPNGLIYDLKRPGPFIVQDVPGIAAGKYEKVSYAVGFDAQFQLVPDAITVPDATLMRNNQFGLYVEGNATKGSLSKEFQWGFTLDTLYEGCAKNGVSGVTVVKDGTETVELTMRGDHLFLDNLASSDAKLRFEAIASADSPTDGTISLEELSKVSLSTIPGMPYGAGGSSEVKTLKDFVFASSRTLGHYRGDGECTSKPQ